MGSAQSSIILDMSAGLARPQDVITSRAAEIYGLMRSLAGPSVLSPASKSHAKVLCPTKGNYRNTFLRPAPPGQDHLSPRYDTWIGAAGEAE